MKFPSAKSAVEWGYEYLTVWRNGKSFSPDPDTWTGTGRRRTGGISDDACSALEISFAMERCCHKGRCPLFNGPGTDCLFFHLFPDPLQEKPSWTDPEKQRFSACLANLEGVLKSVGIVE